MRHERLFLVDCPRSVTEFYGGIVFFSLYQARKYVLTSWYCPRVVTRVLERGCGGPRISVVAEFVCLSEFVCL
jgi:hypothetical protein